MTRAARMASRRAAGGDHLALVEHDHAVRQLEDRAHQMLDEEDGDALLADRADQRIALAISLGLSPDSTSSSRITRGRAARARASSRNLRSCRFSSWGAPAARRPSPVNSSQPRASARGLARRAARGAERGRQRHVLEHGEVRERPRDLIRARDAQRRDLVRGPPGERRRPQRDPARGRPRSGR